MGWWNRSNIGPIGIDLTPESVRMVQLARGATGNVMLTAAALRTIDPCETAADFAARTADLARRMMRQEGFTRRAAVVCLPDDLLHVRTVRIPLATPAGVDPATLPQVKRAFEFDLAGAAPRVLDAGTVRQGDQLLREWIVVAAMNQQVEQFLSAWRTAGIHIESVEIRPCALFRALNGLARQPDAIDAMLEIGSNQSWMIIGAATTIRFVKRIDVGARQLDQSVARKLAMTPDEAAQLRRRLVSTGVGLEGRSDPVRATVHDAVRGDLEQLASSVAACLRYDAVSFRGPRPGRLMLAGTDGSDRHILTCISGRAGNVAVQAANPFERFDVSALSPADRAAPSGEWAAAMGLALKRLQWSRPLPIPDPADSPATDSPSQAAARPLRASAK